MQTVAPRCAIFPIKRREIATATALSWAGVIALGLTSVPVWALEPPSTARVLTSDSADGTFIVTLSGQACGKLEQLILSLEQTPLQRAAQSGCTLALSPVQPVAPGMHCVRLQADFDVEFKETCFQVSGTHPVPSAAGLELGPRVGGGRWADARCEPCAGISTGACTRLVPTEDVDVSLRAPPELASGYAFALLQHIGEAPPVPSDADFGLYGSRIGQTLTLVQREPGAALCVTAFARAFGTTTVQTIGEACTPALEPSSVPAAFRDLSCDGYEQRWCADNRPDCEATPSLAACESYVRVCSSAPETSGLGPSGSMAHDDVDMSGGVSDREETEPLDEPSARQRRAGCQIGRTRGVDGVLMLLLMLGLVARVRALRRKSPDAGR